MQAMLNASEAMRRPDAPGSLGNCPLLLLEHGVPFPPMAAAMEEGWSESPDLVVESVRRVHAAVRNGTQLVSPDSQPSAA